MCSNGGTCIERLGGGFHCICDEGFTGFDCSDDIVDCFPNPCENGGTCDDEVNGFTCQCTEQWTGTVCTEGNELLQPMSQSNVTCLISAYQNVYLQASIILVNSSPNFMKLVLKKFRLALKIM